MFYYNGDLKESHKSGLVKYLYSDTTTWHTRHPDGREVTQFSNGQTEVEIRQTYGSHHIHRYQYDTFAGATRGRQRVHHLPRRHDEGYLPVRSGDHHLPGQDGGHRADQWPEDRQDAAGGGEAAAQTQGPH